VTFGKSDELAYGTPYGDTPFDLGVGNLPAVEYINGTFAGLSNTFVGPDGIGLDADPFNYLFGGFDGHEIGIGLTSAGDPDPIDNIVGEGDIDFSSVTLSAVPEPATWAIMVLGVGLAGFTLRRRARDGRDRVMGAVSGEA
jgi:hypothetical protein